MAVLFDGIYENMSKEDAKNKFTANLESMAKSGEFTSNKINQDISEAMNLIDINVLNGSERVKSSAQSMFDDVASISQFGMDSAVNNIVSSLNNMSDETIKSLSAMGGHWNTLFGGIALTGKDAIVDMKSHINGRLQELSKTSPQFIAEMQTQMDTYFNQINKDAKKNTSDVAKNTDSDMQKANKAVQQSATDMHNGSKKSYSKMADVAKEEGTRMYKGVTTSAQKMSDNAKNSATQMYKGVTTSTRKMADAAIADWNRIKNAYSKPIKGTVMKTTVNKSISEPRNISPTNVEFSNVPLENSIDAYSSFNNYVPSIDVSKYKTSGSYYTSSINNNNIVSNYNSRNLESNIENKLDQLINIMSNILYQKDENIKNNSVEIKLSDSVGRYIAEIIAPYGDVIEQYKIDRYPHF
ncbi:MAG: hypothetical protein ACI3VR_14930 [Intestinibacter sp.]|uniref:hypothetical protein n=1 Tax=Intestinibacter sp. TaxID=1965304 RepID=UPI003F185ADA